MTLAVAGGGRAARQAGGSGRWHQPVLARRVLLLQDFRGDGEVAVWVEQIAGMLVAVRVVAEVDLARGRRRCDWPACGRAPGGCPRRPRRGGVARGAAGDVERPRPGDQAPRSRRRSPAAPPRTAPARGCLPLGGELVGRRRHLLAEGAACRRQPPQGRAPQRMAGGAVAVIAAAIGRSPRAPRRADRQAGRATASAPRRG